MAHVKRTKNPIAKVLRYFKPKTFRNKKTYTRKKKTREEKLTGLISEIGKDMFNVRVQVEWGRCPYCEAITQMLSTRIGYFRCGNCKEITKQYVNGRIAYLPIDDKLSLEDERKT